MFFRVDGKAGQRVMKQIKWRHDYKDFRILRIEKRTDTGVLRAEDHILQPSKGNKYSLQNMSRKVRNSMVKILGMSGTGRQRQM